ncbi:MAG: LLM class flavin-dependent oxidoreductase [Dehalococcoidia bacterium]
MKFGLLYELQFAKPWSDGWERRLFEQSLEQIALADEVNASRCVWAVEHHFLTEYSHSSAPEVFLGAVSQRTRRIRIGHGVVLLPMAYNNPIRVAERIATLDILSADGWSSAPAGRHAGGAGGLRHRPADSKAMWDEAVHIIPRMWTEDPFCHEGASSPCRPARSGSSRCRSPIPPCGWPPRVRAPLSRRASAVSACCAS